MPFTAQECPLRYIRAAAMIEMKASLYLMHLSFVKASSDKLKQEMKDFGYPPAFPTEEDHNDLTEEVKDTVDPNKKVKKVKSKVVAKSVSLKYHWQIMRSLGLSDPEIKK